ncbi:hypothetical protein [Haloferula sp. BvORR071]|uniref:hypothetical protein n=1 Tax=Haloferula sp. BvORR071 TaxID=1396141 RepID=UPI0005540DF3|nr:hypothetical protein [Haloferula sp. BvORR071]
MIPFYLQLAACAALLIAAIYRIATAGKEAAKSHRFLLPFIVVAFGFGVIVAYLLGAELFVAWYSGASYSGKGSPLQPGGTLEWLTPALPCLPLLVGFGTIPAIGRRPLVVAVPTLLASVPALMMIFLQ